MKGHSYAYLVRNVWDNKNGRVRQEIVKYLGRSSKVALEDIPKEYQRDPNVVTFIACHSSDAEKMEFTMKEEMLEALKVMIPIPWLLYLRDILNFWTT